MLDRKTPDDLKNTSTPKKISNKLNTIESNDLDIKIIQIGYPKSGSYWLYKILSEIKAVAGIKHRSFIKEDPIYPLAKEWDLVSKEQADIDMIDVLYQGCFYRISSRYRNRIENLDQYVKKTNHVWTHSNFCSKSPEVFKHFDKVIYIIRDPRDIAVATAKYAFSPYMKKHFPTWHQDIEEYLEKELPGICKSWTNHVMEYLECGVKIHFLFYERLLFDFDNELNSLLEYLQLDLSTSKTAEIKNHVAFNNLLGSNPEQQKPKLYGWKNRLSGWQKSRCLDNAKPLLHFLNYPLKVEDENLPCFASDIKPETISMLRKQMERKSLNERLKMVQDAFK
jgi:aryl sulfotransferase